VREGVQVFTQAKTRNRRRNLSLALSFVLHCVAIYLLVRPAPPVILTPQSVMHGERGASTEITYLAANLGEDAQPAASAPDEQKALRLHARDSAQQKQKRTPTLKTTKVAELPTRAPHAGQPYGTVIEGPVDGHDVRPALPFVFPDPAIRRSEIPDDVNGNVIVEVTIDAQGNVVETRVLQALGHGIEDKVLAALRNWRFRPATLDGVAVPSRQDVYFHFPS
jgi:TonB family protein